MFARLLPRLSLPFAVSRPDADRDGQSPAAPAHRFPIWMIGGAILLGCLYLPTLAAPFDFIDDGNLVYPARPPSVAQWFSVYWGRVVANVEHLGPFRPTLWFHWGVEAELFGGDAVRWRAGRLLWLMLSAGMFLWLMRELGIPRSAALFVGALAMWNPYRNEIWTSLTLSEGVAMPYALAALACAIRAARSSRPGCWDIAGFLCVLTALGCKNTFVALVPAQLFLRIAPDGRDFREGLRRHGPRAVLLAATLLLPAFHYVYFRFHWHPGQYQPNGPTLAQFGRILSGLKGALSLDWLAPGLLLAAAAFGGRDGLRRVWREQRAACLAGGLLLFAGIAVYLPMNMMSGRYTMPAVWGADLFVAALLGVFEHAARASDAGPACSRRVLPKAAYFALGCGLLAVALTNLGRQEKFMARATMLWSALHGIESVAPRDRAVVWVCGPDLNIEEGIHFQWHLQGRGRKDICILLRDAAGRPQSRVELSASNREADFLITGNAAPSPGHGWRPLQEIQTSYWAGRRCYHCYVWRKEKQSSIP